MRTTPHGIPDEELEAEGLVLAITARTLLNTEKKIKKISSLPSYDCHSDTKSATG